MINARFFFTEERVKCRLFPFCLFCWLGFWFFGGDFFFVGFCLDGVFWGGGVVKKN